jgi:homoserine kinase
LSEPLQEGWAEAFAPASVGNVAVGFDLMGHALAGLGDRVRVRLIDEAAVRVSAITGVVTELPEDSARNTAGAALEAMRLELGLEHGFELEIEKGIPLGSGLGGSGASAAAAVVAANALLDDSLSLEELFPYALAGEAAATGAACVDNVAPSLAGGLVFVPPGEPRRLVQIPVPAGLWCAVARPGMVIETRATRAALVEPWPLETIVAQTARLAGVIAGCHAGDFDLLRRSLEDVLVEPRRAELVPGFREAKEAALAAGALGASLSGSGPSVFAWCEGEDSARLICEVLVRALGGDEVAGFVSPVDSPGATLMDTGAHS